jgi:hypothetical protein
MAVNIELKDFKICLNNNEKIDNLIHQIGNVSQSLTDYFSYMKCDNIKTVYVEGEKASHLINPQNDDYNIYFKRKDHVFLSEQLLDNINWTELQKNELRIFIDKINFTLNEGNEFEPFLKRDKVMRFCGLSLFFLFLFFTVCYIVTGIYVQIILSDETDLSKITNNFKYTSPFIYFLLAVFLFAMAIYLLFICYYNNHIKEYERYKYFFDMYKERLEYYIKDWDSLYLKELNSSIEIPMTLEYIHLCLDNSKKQRFEEFKI